MNRFKLRSWCWFGNAPKQPKGFGDHGWPGQYAEALRGFNRLIEAAKLPPETREEILRPLREKYGISLGKEYSLAAFLVGGCFKVFGSDERINTQLGCLVASLGAERFRMQQGRWPKVLDELVEAKLLAKIPPDLLGKGPVQLKQLPDGILIYSVGRDRVDNGGTILESQHWDGSDMGFRLWDVPARRQPPLAPRRDDQE